MDFVIYERDDQGVRQIAIMENGELLGPGAADLKKLLSKIGYKKGQDLTHVLHGQRLWAAYADQGK